MKKHLRIGFVFDDSLDRPDGVQQYITTVGTWLERHGHLVRYLVGETHEPKGVSANSVHSLTRNIGVRGNQNNLSLPLPAPVGRIRQVLDQESFDVVHVQMPYHPFMSGRVINRLPRTTKLVGTFHIVGASWLERTGSSLLGVLQRGTLLRFDDVISVSSAAQLFAKRYYGIESSVIPNAVDTKKFKSGKRKKFLRPTKHTIVFLGRLVERKGADHLLKALKILKDENKSQDVTLHLCGDGPLREELEDYCRNHGLTKQVIFHGFIPEDEKADYLASADLAVFPSTGGESFGIVLVEAMATGQCVVLAGDNPGYRTVMDNNESYLFTPQDHRQLADKIDSYLQNSSDYDKARKWQTKRTQEFDVDRVGAQLLELYKN